MIKILYVKSSHCLLKQNFLLNCVESVALMLKDGSMEMRHCFVHYKQEYI